MKLVSIAVGANSLLGAISLIGLLWYFFGGSLRGPVEPIVLPVIVWFFINFGLSGYFLTRCQSNKLRRALIVLNSVSIFSYFVVLIVSPYGPSFVPTLIVGGTLAMNIVLYSKLKVVPENDAKAS